MSDLTNVDVVVYVLAMLNGATRTVHSEEIAAESHKLAPSRFSWRLRQYRQWPDKYIVKTALEDAKKEEFHSLVEGAYALETSKDGWRLTLQGVEWFERNRTRIQSAFKLKQTAIPKKEAERFLHKFREQKLFQLFKKMKSISEGSIYQFTDMLSCSPDASPEVVRAKFEQVQKIAELVRNEEVDTFLQACASKFEGILSGETHTETESQDRGER